MKNLITNWIDKFEFNFDYSIFAGRLRDKILRAHNVHSVNVDMLITKIIVGNRRFGKFLNGNSRVKFFLTTILESFEKEHELMVSMIEFKEVGRDEQKYLMCKHRISAIIRAKRRFSKIRNNKEEMKSFLEQYINNKRFATKYKLQHN
jgi:hypothetical protein